MEYFEIALKKGELGEKIIQEYLESKGWIVYFPFTKNKAHAFDILCTLNKEKVIAIDVKTKARMNKYNAQGINLKSYNEYLKFKEKMSIEFYLVFVDDKNGDVHTFEIGKEIENFTIGKIIFWWIKDMKFMFNIGKEKIEELSKFDQRKYNYKPT
jgi:Holliday junction resolvase